MKVFIIALISLSACYVAVNANPAWSDLRASFLIGKQEAFAPFPRSIRDPQFASENWTAVNSTPNDCTNGGQFVGIQYVKGNDFSVGLLFDNNGIIAGIQMLLPKATVLSPNNTLNYGAIPMYQSVTYNNQDYYVLTAYFVDPSTICSSERNDDSLSSEGTGTGLWIQNGTSVTLVPSKRPEATQNGWTENNCFLAMGYHNFYQLQQYYDTNCTEMYPIFGLYNQNDDLHGFGFITIGYIDNPRFEHPPQSAIKMILGSDKTPQCVLDHEERVGISSLHVWFVPRPWLITCSIARAVGSYITSARNWLSNLG